MPEEQEVREEGARHEGSEGTPPSPPAASLPRPSLPSPDTLARRAYDAFYAALGVPHQPWGWEHLRPVVKEAWRVVVAVVRESGEDGPAAREDG